MTGTGRLARIGGVLRSLLSPAVLLHPFRMLHYYGYSHVLPRGRMTLGRGVRLAPNTSFRNGERIALADNVQLGEHSALWAGKSRAWIRVGAGTTFGPGCFVTAANYGLSADRPIVEQQMQERDITIGAGCWIGAKSVIVAGVTLGDGCVVGAGSIVTRNVPANAIVAGNPARVLRMRT